MEILERMLSKEPKYRPSVNQIKEYVEVNLKTRKIVIPKTIRAEKLEIKGITKESILKHRIK
jgi:hypothetical protein